MKPQPHTAQYKKDEADRLRNVLKKYKVIAVADMTGMPSPQLQRLRNSTKDSLLITMSKGRIIKIVFGELKNKIKGIEELKECIKGMPGLIFTNDNPFRLSKILQKSKSSAPAKAGQLAPNDIIVSAGPTPFPPGPIIGELGQVGIKASVVDGKVAVKEDKVVVREGQEITAPVANVLAKLGMEPMEIGINLLAALENGVIFTKQVLNINDEEYKNNIRLAYTSAFNLAFKIKYTTKDNIKMLLQKAYREAGTLADKGGILTSENIKKRISQASSEAEALKSKLNLPDVIEEVPEKETKVEKVSAQKTDEKKSGEKQAVRVEVHKVEPKIEEKKAEKIPEKKYDNKKGSHESIKNDEAVAQQILKRLQDEKMGKQTNEKEDRQFKENEKVAQDVLKKIQDEKMKKEKRR